VSEDDRVPTGGEVGNIKNQFHSILQGNHRNTLLDKWGINVRHGESISEKEMRHATQTLASLEQTDITKMQPKLSRACKH